MCLDDGVNDQLKSDRSLVRQPADTINASKIGQVQDICGRLRPAVEKLIRSLCGDDALEGLVFGAVQLTRMEGDHLNI